MRVNFWKLVGAIIVANLITGVLAGVLWWLVMSVMIGSLAGEAAELSVTAVGDSNLDYLICQDAAATPEAMKECHRRYGKPTK